MKQVLKKIKRFKQNHKTTLDVIALILYLLILYGAWSLIQPQPSKWNNPQQYNMYSICK